MEKKDQQINFSLQNYSIELENIYQLFSSYPFSWQHVGKGCENMKLSFLTNYESHLVTNRILPEIRFSGNPVSDKMGLGQLA